MSFAENTCAGFVQALASKLPIPGGGGASALVGAIGMALGSMVGNLTIGKKKYVGVEPDIVAIMDKATALQEDLLRLMDEDAAAFEPLSKAYGIPKDDPNRERVMEDALKLACTAPMDIMRLCARAIELQGEFSEKGNKLALSDAGAGVLFCKAALQGASLNVFINTQSMKDREFASSIDKEAEALLGKYNAMADDIYFSVRASIS